MHPTVTIHRATPDAAAAEVAALADVLIDCVAGGDAERLYARAGWQRVGEVPHFALMPDGAPCGTTFFYKRV